MSNYIPGVTLITPTGDRPEALRLCAHYVLRQTYRGPLSWIVVDDGVVPADLREETHQMNARGWLVNVVRREGTKNSLAQNLLAAIGEVGHEKVLIIEDDDHYAAVYVSMMAAWLEAASFVGGTVANYYHIPSRRYRVLLCTAHASLCQTGLRASGLSRLEAACRTSANMIDVRFWDKVSPAERIFHRAPICVGIKGMPGRPGIGIGHRPGAQPGMWSADENLSVLRSWIGDDVEMYREFL